MKSKDYHACLLFGGNLNDVKAAFVRATEKIKNFAEVTKTSSLYRTKAWGMEEGTPDFVNQAILIKTEVNPVELMQELQEIEQSLGRIRNMQKSGYQSRTIDIDIIAMEDRVINEDGLIVPHPRMHLRSFVLVPMMEVLPLWKHPVLKKTVSKLLLDLSGEGEVQEI